METVLIVLLVAGYLAGLPIVLVGQIIGVVMLLQWIRFKRRYEGQPPWADTAGIALGASVMGYLLLLSAFMFLPIAVVTGPVLGVGSLYWMKAFRESRSVVKGVPWDSMLADKRVWPPRPTGPRR